MRHVKAIHFALICLAATGLDAPAAAELLLSEVIVDLPSHGPTVEDIEAYNSGEERMYVAAEPYEVTGAGTADEKRVPVLDPAQSGLFVSPRKIILEPGERRTIRVAAVGPRPDRERVYRVAIKPVAGVVTASRSALKVFVGYDALVIVRPDHVEGKLEATRESGHLALRNNSNASIEIFDGKQCDNTGEHCISLPGKRLYAGASWQLAVPHVTPIHMKTIQNGEVADIVF